MPRMWRSCLVLVRTTSYFRGKPRTTHVCMENNKMYTAQKKTHYTALYAFVWLVALLLFPACTTTRVVEHEIVKHDSIYITAIAVDTILQHDSIHIVDRGDTVTTTIYKYIYKVKERTDTMFVERTDTITKFETKTVTKTETRKDWLSIIGAFFVGVIIGILTLPTYRLFSSHV